ncbi:MAG: hypothetical protein CM1200mP6_03090 [Anaerolineaceae bacterium]|nr:MAG: hypothetical protein CM1200mP6_03090 [Anaerolineaceae bacterium]
MPVNHGDMLGDHGKWGKGTWRDPAVRIPLNLLEILIFSHVGLRSDPLGEFSMILRQFFLVFAGCSQLEIWIPFLAPTFGWKIKEQEKVLISEFGDWSLYLMEDKRVLDTKRKICFSI